MTLTHAPLFFRQEIRNYWEACRPVTRLGRRAFLRRAIRRFLTEEDSRFNEAL